MSEHEDHGPQPPAAETEPIVVGIGASAGGLAALRRLFSQIPSDTGMAFVVVVHLSPDHESFLADLVQPDSALPVMQVARTTALQPDHVYVIPPGSNLDSIDTHVRLTQLEEDRRRRAPIDHFFRTLAAAHDGRAIGIVLTGTGSDGALGIQRIKERGGLTIVQDPTDAEYDGMPQAAIATDAVDLVLPLDQIPETLLRVARTRPRIHLPHDDAVDDDAKLLVRLFSQMQGRTERDFSRYKRSTLVRRIGRRMQLRGVSDLGAYLDVVRESHDEVHALADDLLITVSGFFRDPDVFDAVAGRFLPQLFEGKGPDDEIRVWSVGCATGEEAYTLAMLLIEEADRHGPSPRLLVFASDLHEHSLARAREGFYPGDIEDEVSPERLERFFRREEGGYRVRDAVRDVVLFAPHDLLGDPPFSRLDLVSCRNVLIYLQRDVQRDVARVFHYALRPNGFLLLGTSETTDAAEMFAVEDKQHCIYRKRDLPVEPQSPVFPLTLSRSTVRPDRPTTANETPPSYVDVHGRMLATYGPPSLLVAPDDRIVHVSRRANRYLVHREGQISDVVSRVVRDEILLELRSALHVARERREGQRSRPVSLDLDGQTVVVVVVVQPARAEEDGYVLVMFDEVEVMPSSAAVAEMALTDAESVELREEIRLAEHDRDAARHRLQSIVEEYETSQEELKSSNEQLQSANEELRSTLEELETSREELQSMNEELLTVAQENRHKVDELSQLSSDLNNLLSATDIATLFLDRDLRIMRFTPAVTRLFNVRTTDRGRPISDLTHRLGYDGLADDANEVLRRLVPIEHEVSDLDDRWYLTRLLPYRTADDRIDGVVITMVDITTQRQAVERLRASEQLFRATADHLPLLVWAMDPSGSLTWVNRTYCDYFGLERESAIGEGWRALVHPDDLDRLVQQLLDAQAGHLDLHDEVRVRHADGTWRWIELWAQPRFDADGTFFGHLGTSADVTDRKRADEALQRSAEQAVVRAELLDAVRHLDDPIAIQANVAVTVSRHLAASRVYYATVDDDGTWATVEADHGPGLPSVVGRHRLDDYGPIITTAMRKGQVIAVDDLEHDDRLDPRHRQATLTAGVRSVVIAPLVRDGDVVAVMIAQQSMAREWRSSEVAILEEALGRTWWAVERARALRAMRVSEERLRQLLDAVPSVIFTTDDQGRVEMTIGQVPTILGVEPDAVIGTVMWPEVVDAEDRPVVQEAWKQAIATGQTFEIRYRIAPTGRWVMVRSVPLRDESERVVQWFGTITDVDALTTTERALADANATLEQRVLAGTERVRALASRLSRVEHDERRRLSQVLHDDLQQVLFSLQLRLAAVQEVPEVEANADANARLADAQSRLQRAIDVTRNLTIDLSPPLLDGDDLEDMLQWLVSYMAELHGLDVTLEVTAPEADDDVRVMLFHVARELLFNVAKHAETKAATVRVAGAGGELTLSVSDHGRGFDPASASASNGVGLVRVRERLQLLGGSLTIESQPGAGATITACVPVDDERRPEEAT